MWRMDWRVAVGEPLFEVRGESSSASGNLRLPFNSDSGYMGNSHMPWFVSNGNAIGQGLLGRPHPCHL
jgi:hypothetical protein